jgi:hypothetical protein
VGTTRVSRRPALLSRCRIPAPSALALPVPQASVCRRSCLVRRIVIRKHRLDNQDPATRIHRAPTVTEDREAVVRRPVVDDVRKKIGIAAAWNSIEEAARLSIVTRSAMPRD